MWQYIAYTLEEAVGIYTVIIDISGVFELVPHNRLLKKLGFGRGIEGSRLCRGIRCRSYSKGKLRRTTTQECQSNHRCVAKECFGPTTVSSVRK